MQLGALLFCILKISRKGGQTKLNKIKKLLTLEDLANFCKEQNFSSFSSKDTGYQLSVQLPATFEVESEYQDNTLLFCSVKLFHIGANRNGSSVTENAATKSLPTTYGSLQTTFNACIASVK